jgi:hypothetical protein
MGDSAVLENVGEILRLDQHDARSTSRQVIAMRRAALGDDSAARGGQQARSSGRPARRGRRAFPDAVGRMGAPTD